MWMRITQRLLDLSFITTPHSELPVSQHCSEKRDVPETAGLKYCQQDCYMCTYILLVTPVNWKQTNKRTSGNGLWAKRVDTYKQCRKNKSGGCNRDPRMEVLPLAVIFPSL